MNPIRLACRNKQCAAAAGEPCRSVGRRIKASPHTPRMQDALDVALPDADPFDRFSDPIARECSLAYTDAVLEQLLGRKPTETEIARAKKEDSLNLTKGWLAKAVVVASPATSTSTRPNEQFKLF